MQSVSNAPTIRAVRSRSSFDCLQHKWIRKVVDEAEADCHICIVGTKLDLVEVRSLPALLGCKSSRLTVAHMLYQMGLATRAVPREEVIALTAKHCADLFETSAKQACILAA